MPAKLLVVQNWGKMAHFLQPTGRPLFEFLYISQLSVMTLHYHRLYYISSLEANVCSEDMK